MPSIVALIPARSGSKRIPGKNMRLLGAYPLLEWTITAVHDSAIFDHIIVSSDSKEYLDYAVRCSTWPHHRLLEHATDAAPDYLWVQHLLEHSERSGFRTDPNGAFAILRPTSPFRTAETIRRAWQQFLDSQPCDSLRAVEPVKQHPGKMWAPRHGRAIGGGHELLIEPLIPLRSEVTDQPWHSSPTQTLPTYYVQNASLEIAWTKTITEKGTISGDVVIPFFTQGIEGFDINDEDDWREAERIAESLKVAV